MVRVRIAVVLTFLICVAAPASAQSFIAPFLGFNYGGDVSNICASLTNCDDRRSNWGVAFGKMGSVFGFEEEIGYSKNFFGDTPNQNNSVLTLMSNLTAGFPIGPVRPYGLFGLGLVHPNLEFGTSSLNVTHNALGYDLGAGVNVFFSRGFGIRGDIRHIKTFDDLTLGIFEDQQINFWRGSAGLVFRF